LAASDGVPSAIGEVSTMLMKVMMWDFRSMSASVILSRFTSDRAISGSSRLSLPPPRSGEKAAKSEWSRGVDNPFVLTSMESPRLSIARMTFVYASLLYRHSAVTISQISLDASGKTGLRALSRRAMDPWFAIRPSMQTWLLVRPLVQFITSCQASVLHASPEGLNRRASSLIGGVAPKPWNSGEAGEASKLVTSSASSLYSWPSRLLMAHRKIFVTRGMP